MQKTKQNKTLRKIFLFHYKQLPNLPIVTHFITIKVTPNNTFITLTDANGNCIRNLSAGNCGLNSSKRTYKYVAPLIINHFFSLLNTDCKYLLKLIAPKQIKKRLLKLIDPTLFLLLKNPLIRPFNGCRPPKRRRKKKKALFILSRRGG